MKIIKKIFILVLILIVIVALGIHYVNKNNNINVVEKLAKLIILPDEVATIAKVTDMTKLESQKFFKNANNGDLVIIFPNSQKAILYRERINKIIDVSNELPKEDMVVPTVVLKKEDIKNTKIVLLNGTESVGLTNIWEKTILESIIEIEIIDKQKAVETNYKKTVIVDVSGKFIDKVDQLKKMFNAQVVSIPSDEVSNDADILVILGKDSILP